MELARSEGGGNSSVRGLLLPRGDQSYCDASYSELAAHVLAAISKYSIHALLACIMSCYLTVVRATVYVSNH